jgi:hypothetical protein
MGKKPTKKSSKEVQAMDALVRQEGERELQIQKILEQYGDGQPYERLRYESEVKFFKARAAEDFIEIGKRFIVAKVIEGHGGFLKFIENVDVSERFARYAMAAAQRFSNRQSIADLGSTKMMALTVLDDDQIQTLEDGGEVFGMTVDDVDRMTVSQLKQTIRDGRKQLEEAKEKIEKAKKLHKEALDMKEAKINDLNDRLLDKSTSTDEQIRYAKARDALEPLKKKLFEHLLQAQFHLDEAVNVAAAAQKVEGATFPQLQEWAKAHYEQLAPIGDLFEELDQALNNCGPDKKA